MERDVTPARLCARLLFACFIPLLVVSCGGGAGETATGVSGSSGTPPPASRTRELQASVQYLLPPLSAPTGQPSLRKTLVADLNGDGLSDVVTFTDTTVNGADVLVYYQNQNGEFGAMLPLNSITDLNLIYVHDVAADDLNGDGYADLVVLGIAAPQTTGCGAPVAVLYQDVNGELDPPTYYGASTTCIGIGNRLAIGDLNSDGRNDLVFSGSPIVAFFQNPNGTLGAPTQISNAFSIGEVHIADMDGDNDNDLVIQSRLGSADKLIGVVRQTSPGQFTANADYYEVLTSYSNGFHTFAVGDVNGDGKADVVALDPGNYGYLNIFLQNPVGTLDNPVLVTVLSSPLYGVEIADIDGDGLNDILGDVVDPGVPGRGQVHVFYQSPQHTFQIAAEYGFPTTAGGGSAVTQALSVGDVTGDGRPDAIVSWIDEGLFVLENVPL
jgi:hypothetical protein